MLDRSMIHALRNLTLSEAVLELRSACVFSTLRVETSFSIIGFCLSLDLPWPVKDPADLANPLRPTRRRSVCQHYWGTWHTCLDPYWPHIQWSFHQAIYVQRHGRP